MAGKNDKYIDITIHPDGKVEADAVGYKGKGCAEDIAEVLNGLGRKIESKKKRDFFDKQQVRTTQHHG